MPQESFDSWLISYVAFVLSLIVHQLFCWCLKKVLLRSWFHMRHLFCLWLFINSSVSASGKLYFVIGFLCSVCFVIDCSSTLLLVPQEGFASWLVSYAAFVLSLFINSSVSASGKFYFVIGFICGVCFVFDCSSTLLLVPQESSLRNWFHMQRLFCLWLFINSSVGATGKLYFVIGFICGVCFVFDCSSTLLLVPQESSLRNWFHMRRLFCLWLFINSSVGATGKLYFVIGFICGVYFVFDCSSTLLLVPQESSLRNWFHMRRLFCLWLFINSSVGASGKLYFVIGFICDVCFVFDCSSTSVSASGKLWFVIGFICGVCFVFDCSSTLLLVPQEVFTSWLVSYAAFVLSLIVHQLFCWCPRKSLLRDWFYMRRLFCLWLFISSSVGAPGSLCFVIGFICGVCFVIDCSSAFLLLVLWEGCASWLWRFFSHIFKHFYALCPIKGTFANSVDPDQTPQNAASDQDQHCLH